jgi:hypothetical protein
MGQMTRINRTQLRKQAENENEESYTLAFLKRPDLGIESITPLVKQ